MAKSLQKHYKQLLAEWAKHLQSEVADGRKVRISPQELRTQADEFLQLLTAVVTSANPDDRHSAQFKALQGFLENLSRSRAQQGFTSAETAMFIFSFKQPLFAALRAEAGNDANLLADENWNATRLLDELGLITVTTYQQAREEIISRQQQEMLELSTPVVKLWEGILALPMIGTLDSARTQVVMESLLQKIVETGSQIAIIDITGVPTVDTLVAQHLLKTVTAIRLMGADCIISGVRPQIAQTIVHLGVDLAGVTTKANLADALALALKRTGNTLSR
ncbi:MAG TPA: STAS domain-containing protein [Steroidobacteraceae bacterium]|nr:STAS domain-containing protein [Steroidobacteraceae bacterium]